VRPLVTSFSSFERELGAFWRVVARLTAFSLVPRYADTLYAHGGTNSRAPTEVRLAGRDRSRAATTPRKRGSSALAGAEDDDDGYADSPRKVRVLSVPFWRILALTARSWPNMALWVVARLLPTSRPA